MGGNSGERKGEMSPRAPPKGFRWLLAFCRSLWCRGHCVLQVDKWVGEMARQTKCLPHRQDCLVQLPNTIVNTRPGRDEGGDREGRPQGLTGQPVKLKGKLQV